MELPDIAVREAIEEEVRRARCDLGLKQKELAQLWREELAARGHRTKLNQSSISSIETARSTPSFPRMVALEAVLGLPAGRLTGLLFDGKHETAELLSTVLKLPDSAKAVLSAGLMAVSCE